MSIISLRLFLSKSSNLNSPSNSEKAWTSFISLFLDGLLKNENIPLFLVSVLLLALIYLSSYLLHMHLGLLTLTLLNL